MPQRSFSFFIQSLISSILLLSFLPAQAIETTQTVPLSLGWNAVWLEVDPVETSGPSKGSGKAVATVFSDAAIEVVATPKRSHGTIEFINDANSGFFNASDWQVWHKTTELGSNTLGVVRGYRAYLVKASAATTLNITGTAKFYQPEWQANQYNLVGFGLQGAVTFGQFFAAAGTTHPVNQIFKLDAATGNWVNVLSSETMVSGKAYWIYSAGQSSYPDDLKVSFLGAGSLNFGSGPANINMPDPNNNASTLPVNIQEVVFTNTSSANKSITLSKALPNTGAASNTDELRIYEVQPNPTTSSYDSAGGLINNTSFAITASSSLHITLGANRNWSAGDETRENLYRIEFEHHYVWLPASASRGDLSGATVQAANPASVGLWIGNVVIDQVTSATEAGRPLSQTTSKAPLRVLVHVDAAGNANLLSHVMFMQTKTADPAVSPSQVLVLNEQKIPFYEGVQERGGKKVGMRLEAVTYDMPRKNDRTAQSALIAEVATHTGKTTANVTDADIAAYIAQLGTRSPQLTEDYHFKWALTGSLGLNSTVQTGSTPLIMDAFHRSNPFRHAFHPQHGTGKNLTRAITIHLDGSGTSDVLRGTFSETINGLAAFPLISSGAITLERVSTTATLVE